MTQVPPKAPGLFAAEGGVRPEREPRAGPESSPAVSSPVAIRVEVADRVRIVIPCFDRPRDLELLLGDLARLELETARGPVELAIVVVDNASSEPLAPIAEGFADRLQIETLRLADNRGGSGGFNAGMNHWLDRAAGDEGFIWLLDSDARVEPQTLRALLEALHMTPAFGVAGSALHDPVNGALFELGGAINRRTGEYEQPLPPAVPVAPIRVEYVAACSMLIRGGALARTRQALGLMPEMFLNGDDIALCLNIRRATGLQIAAVPASRAFHPTPDKPRTIGRYYAARNALHVLRLAGAPRRARLIRALRETGRAIGLVCIGRGDLAELHVRGLADGPRGVEASGALPRLAEASPMEALASRVAVLVRPGSRVAVRADAAVAACVPAGVGTVLLPASNATFVWRVAMNFVWPRYDVAFTTGRGRLADARLARVMVSDAGSGFVERRVRLIPTLAAAARVGGLGVVHAIRWMCAPAAKAPLASVVPTPAAAAPIAAFTAARQTASLTITTIVLSFNRRETLGRTLVALLEQPRLAHQILVVDNGSTSPPLNPVAFRAQFPGVELLTLSHNRGVEAFNIAAKRATGDALLILDDDAIPEAGAVEAAAALLADRPDLAAVTLHPRHPETRLSEWPFGEHLADCVRRDPSLRGLEDRWPVMGCANLVRRSAWAQVAGYDAAFFLYRNDSDLAMKLLAEGHGVAFRPEWVVWHDSPGTLPGARKSRRWLQLATRNWAWLCRRHGRGRTIAFMIAGQFVTASRQAGLRPVDQLAVVRGVCQGLTSRVPPIGYMDTSGPRRGQALADLWRLRLAARKASPRRATESHGAGSGERR